MAKARSVCKALNSTVLKADQIQLFRVGDTSFIRTPGGIQKTTQNRVKCTILLGLRV